MTPAEALAFIRLHADTKGYPALSDAEEQQVLRQSRAVDSQLRLVTDPLYEETIWGTRAVVVALDAKVAKAAVSVDVSSDGSSVHASQRIEQLERQRRSWRSRALPGTP